MLETLGEVQRPANMASRCDAKEDEAVSLLAWVGMFLTLWRSLKRASIYKNGLISQKSSIPLL